ncbi:MULTISPECIES: diaminobutyrate--2-oxoglutarate transaminase family protein [Pseudomonas]|uniref:diaminobutyrate--2-oxoglutarate transaminase family protein n=1 Tax=Pseudomonas TaxID=286 RepID=UPI0008766D46|nr:MULTISPECIES: diaminobutyrate--2-oxoglutarate transaminase family protein [Pseudomonas]MDT8905851.1 diaminobutyrate--2-oxoglutarate transaminase family protein [Pseudomonas prosekii]NHN67951.1 diaminobutyrate--2-oxoglutarate transaminase family protein [Pseudomonas fluorescens]ROO34724.1 diaminobutyrate--2-oxoglutarate transaminase [Pseudomonas sp. 7SR1]SCX71587.1 diaminobutyrate-2-oxoglutarate transaminase [Pseudomonas sp. NFACC32-1]SFY19729.1 diaminobutyrate-2-oxoglutarate transaminase [P
MEALSYLENVESNARTYAQTFQRLFVSGKGMRIRDASGQEYLDCLSNAGTLALGHNPPEVRDAVMAFLGSDHLQQALDLATPAKHAFVQELFSMLPAKMREASKILFCGPSGSDAVEAAIKLARHYTRRSPLMAFHGGYHGMTAGALSAMGKLSPKSGDGLIAQGTHFLPFPYRFRCPFGTAGEHTDQLSIDYIRTVLSDPEGGVAKPAAVIVEVVQGEGGCIPASAQWLRALREITLEQDILLIVDEVQTGLGRTGTTFAIEHAGIVPDILVLSKAIGGGYPLAVVVYAEHLDTWGPGMHAGTFRGNQVAMVAGVATMQQIRRDNLVANAARMGELLQSGLRDIARRFACMGDIRGRGLMIGVEITRPAANQRAGQADGALAHAIKLNCFDNGLMMETGGRHGAVLRFLPPLTITEAEVGMVLDRFEQALAKTHETRPHLAREAV